MSRNVMAATAALVVLFSAGSAGAASFKLSLGIRETGGSGPIFANGGSANGIEWVNLDGQTLNADGTWQFFTFTPAQDTLTAFAGATANGVLAQNEWAVLEHIRILNSDGVTAPIRLWIDDVTNFSAVGSATEGFEAFAPGTEVMFQEPGFSGSTSANINLATDAGGVTATAAFAGTQSYLAEFQFVDGTATRWVRLTTSNSTQLPNPLVRVLTATGSFPSIRFYARAEVIPEPGTFALVGLSGLALIAIRRSDCC